MLSRALVFPVIDPEFKLNGTTLVFYYDTLDLSFEKYTYFVYRQQRPELDEVNLREIIIYLKTQPSLTERPN